MTPATGEAKRDVPGIVISAIVFGIGILVLLEAREFSPMGSIFPRTVAAIMMIFCAAYMIVAWRRPQPVGVGEQGSSLRRVGLFAVLLLWSIAFSTVGFLTTSVIAYAAITLLATYGRWTASRVASRLVAGIAILALFYLLFKVALHVPLPSGWLL